MIEINKPARRKIDWVEYEVYFVKDLKEWAKLLETVIKPFYMAEKMDNWTYQYLFRLED